MAGHLSLELLKNRETLESLLAQVNRNILDTAEYEYHALQPLVLALMNI